LVVGLPHRMGLLHCTRSGPPLGTLHFATAWASFTVPDLVRHMEHWSSACRPRASRHWRGCTTWSLDIVRVENGRKNSRSSPFRFPLLSVRFRICEVSFPYLRKWERGFSVRFRGIPFSPDEIDPYLFRFSSHFKSI
jgi:hypothetical protein